jgi:hypothetical protein
MAMRTQLARGEQATDYRYRTKRNMDNSGDVAVGKVRKPLAVTGLAANFWPMPRRPPPPLGNEVDDAPGKEHDEL